MAKLKLPSISKNVSAAVKPSAVLVRSIISKLGSKIQKMPKISSPKSQAGSSLASSGMKGLGSLSKKFGGLGAAISSKAFNPKLPSIKTRISR